MIMELSLLEEYGNQLREPYSKYLRDDIFELRIKVGSDISRILYFFFKGKHVVLTNGFVKKDKKTPIKEIERACTYRRDYYERVKEEEYA